MRSSHSIHERVIPLASILKSRIRTGLILFVVFVVALLPLEGLIARLLVYAATVCAYVEWIFSIPPHLPRIRIVCHLAYSTALLVIVFAANHFLPHSYLIASFIAAFGYDVFAFCFGSWLGGELFGDSRPFPKTSPNKTWEGVVLGTSSAIILCLIFGYIWPIVTHASHPSLTPGVALGPIAACAGDYLNSRWKRSVGLDDSCDHTPLTARILPGHGGVSDRFVSLYAVYIAYALCALVL